MIATRPAIRLAAPSFLAVAAVLAAVAIVPGGARAQCATVTAGFTVIGFECTGLDPDGIAVGRPGVIGEVGAGARVEGGDAIALGERATVIVEGEVEAEDTGVAGGDRLTVLNEGRVAGGTAGVRAGDFLVLRNALGAAVTGGEVGVAAGEDPQIVNSGTIGGIRGTGLVTVRNDAGGTIGGIGSNFGVTLDNAGSVSGGISSGFDTRILNRASGVLRGGVSSGPGFNRIENEGLVDGEVYATQGLGVTNTGTFLGAVIATDEGPGVRNSGLFRGAVVGVGNGAGGLVNTGEAISDGDLVVGATGAFLTNSGSVVAGGSAVKVTDDLASAFVTNDGLITTGGDGVVGGIASRIDNTGSIVAGSRGLDLGAEARIANGQFEDRDAVIRGDLDGVRVGEDARIESFGLVQGATGAAIRAGSGLDLFSEGPIRGGSDGVVIEGVGSVFVGEGGEITAAGVGVQASGSVSVQVGLEGGISGGEAGVVGGDGSFVAVFESGSSIFAGGDAVRLGRDAFVGNDDTISSTGSGDGVSVVDGSIDNNAGILSRNGAGVRARAGELGTEPAGPLNIRNEGVIVGVVGIQADAGNEGTQSVTNLGLFSGSGVRGTSGVAMDLGAGDDSVTNLFGPTIEGDVLFGTGDDVLRLTSGTAITGDTLFGPGDDVLRYERSMFDRVADVFGLFAGGAGFDEAVFEGFGLGELDASPVAGGFDLLFEDGASRLSATLTGFERVRLDDVTLSFPGSPTPAPIPLPAALPLLAAALGGLAMLRRRGCSPDPLPTA